MADFIPDERFEVTSGALCFGEPHNIEHGASVPIVSPTLVEPKVSRTVFVHDIEFNIAAVNGQWEAYKLFWREKEEDPDSAERRLGLHATRACYRRKNVGELWLCAALRTTGTAKQR